MRYAWPTIAGASFLLTPAAAASAQVEVGELELMAVRVDASRAGATLASAWAEILRGAGLTDAADAGSPVGNARRIVAYRDSQVTACDTLGPENAYYCTRDDTIYYDEWFVAAIRGLVGQELETDGDHAVFTILAHEWGHRIYARFRPETTTGIPVFAELAADCLAGAALREAGRRVPLTPDDSAEALLAVRFLGDEPDGRASTRLSFRGNRPAPGDPAAPGRAQRGLTRHGDPDERVRSFQRGLRHGAGKCMKELAPP